MEQRHAHPHGSRKSEQLRRDTPSVFCWAAEPADGITVRRSFRRCVFAEHHDGKHSWDTSDSDASDALKDELQDAVKNSLDTERAVRTSYADDYTHAPMRHGTCVVVKPRVVVGILPLTKPCKRCKLPSVIAATSHDELCLTCSVDSRV